VAIDRPANGFVGEERRFAGERSWQVSFQREGKTEGARGGMRRSKEEARERKRQIE